MGEAKRRKKKDPNYGKSEMIGDRTYLEWKKYLYFTDREWREIKPYFRVVDSVNEVDREVDGVWIYINEGQRNIAFTGRFTSYLPSNGEVLTEPPCRVVDSFDDIDDSIDAIWKYKDRNGRQKIFFTGKFSEAIFETFISPSGHVRK